MIFDYFKIAVDSLFHRKVRSWLTMIGIFIGIASVVALISLGQGMQNAITSQFSTLGTDKLIITAKDAGYTPPGSDVVKALTKHDKDVIKRVSGIKLVAGRLLRPAKIEVGTKDVIYGYAISIPEDTEERQLVLDVMNYDVSAGRILKGGDKNKVIVGSDIANSEALSKKINLNNMIKIQGKEFKVVAVLKKKGNPMLDGSITLMEDDMRALYDLGEDYHIIPAQIEAGLKPADVAKNVEKALRKDHDVKEGEEDFSVQTPEEAFSIVNTVLAIVQAVLIGIASISLIVGGIGIMNTMYTAVLERTKEIGIMKAIGAKNSDILSIFLVESGMLGIVGGAIGIAIGVALSKTVEFIAAKALGTALIQASFPLPLIIGALLFSFVVGSLAGLLPAIQASRMQPVDALRYG